MVEAPIIVVSTILTFALFVFKFPLSKFAAEPLDMGFKDEPMRTAEG
jgi:hypothetical protein